MKDGLVCCEDCDWVDECLDKTEDGWCEDFCINIEKLKREKKDDGKRE